MHGPIRRSEAGGSKHLIPRFFQALALACLVSVVLVVGAQGVTIDSMNTVVVDGDGHATPSNCNSAALAYSTIQDAVNAAAVSTKIKVCPGTYPEQVTVSTNQITIQSAQIANQAVIQAPDPFLAPGAIVRFTGGSTGGVLKNVKVTGTFNTVDCNPSLYGVRIDGSAQAAVQGNTITEIRSTDPGLRGCQNGVAIQVGRNFESQAGVGTITGNTINTYAKNGITIDGPGSSATVTGNTVTGNAPDGTITAQNGIQVSRSAIAKVKTNNVSQNIYTGGSGDNATGILVYLAAGGTAINSNTVDNNDDNLSLYGTIGATVNGNHSTNAVVYDGLFADSASANNKFVSNIASGNVNDFDCLDLSTGPKTAGTANTWKFNTGATSSPVGICAPPVGSSGSGTVGHQTRVRPVTPSLVR
jgi:hypothetical protein